MSTAPLTIAELREFLADQVPTAKPSELDRAARALALMFRLSHGEPAPKAAARGKPTRRFKDKPVAESMNLKQ